MFYGRNFMYDGKASETYGVRILNFEIANLIDSPSGAESTLYQKWLYKKQEPYFFGRAMNTPLIFDLTIGASDSISGFDRSVISKWLMGRSTYKKFQVDQDDVMNVYWNCIAISATNKYVGNIQQAMTIRFQCSAPWGRTFDQTLNYTFAGDTIKNFDFEFYNSSDSHNYLYPIVEFALNSIGDSFQITNYSDDDRIFSFTGLQANETITVDNDKQTVVSDTGLRRLSLFNKGWFRFIPGLNNLNIISGIGTVDITYSFARKIGA